MLIIYGVAAEGALSLDISQVFTDSPSQKAVVLLCGGAVIAVLGGLDRGVGQRDLNV